MELNIDLLPKTKRSNFTLAMGLISVALCISYFIFNELGEEKKTSFQIPIMIYFGLNGLNGIMTGLGYSMEKLFGSAYVRIDDDTIAIKPGVWKKVRLSQWSQIQSLEYKTNWFKINYLDGSSSKLLLSDLEFKVLMEAKNMISAIAAEKGILIH